MELGTKGEEFKYKLYYFLWIIFVFLFLFWSWIGNVNARQTIEFYLFFGLFALAFILFDNLTRKTFNFIDSITIEKPAIKFLSPKVSFIIALIAALLISINIFRTGQAWVNYPKFQVFDSKYLNAFLSGVLGVVENWVFFAFLFPTTYAILNLKLKNGIVAFLLGLMIINLIFSIFHIFVYGTQPSALFSTIVFSSLCVISTYALRNMLLADALHLSNNFAAYIISARVGLAIRL